MDKLIINGGRALSGAVVIPSAKNAVLAELAACMLCRGEVIINNCPLISDVQNILRILEVLGCRYTFIADQLLINCRNASGYEIPAELAAELRASIFLLGATLGRNRRARVAYPGGCAIGNRPINLHLKALGALNVQIEEQNGYLVCDGSQMRAGSTHLDSPSVGATENFIMAAATLEGTSRIENAAKEPEIIDLADFINAMGGSVRGAGSPIIEIDGVAELFSTKFTPIPDRIIAGTYLIGCAMTGGSITLNNCEPSHLSSLISKLSECGAVVESGERRIALSVSGRLTAPDLIETLPYPGFPTDLQAQMGALAAISEGTSLVVENLFEARFRYAPELIKMGANITVRGSNAIVRGVGELFGAEVFGYDLRGTAALVLAGLAAKGTTTVHNVHYLDRGYYRMEEALRTLGADIVRVSD